MIFTHTAPLRKYADYTKYRPYLRKDFRYRCAYCLRHEGHNGGEANFCIDHHRPVGGPFGRPDLKCNYANLYYVCCECNEHKADHWPTEDEFKQGLRFMDPCLPDDDHDLHWRFHPDGSIQSLTNVGKYTDAILLLWRPQLRHWRATMYQRKFRSFLLIDESITLRTFLYPAGRLAEGYRDGERVPLANVRPLLDRDFSHFPEPIASGCEIGG